MGTLGSPGEAATLIDELLAEQRTLTVVDRFSHRHELNDVPAQARYYRDLIPLAKPQAGQQYAFEVDLDKCSGCKACVTACHNLNGLDDEETWRNVGLLHGGTFLQPIQQTITTSCHHCLDPACLNGCPVLAYEKDPVTGIVRHLDDQCIGCQYCVLKCPYDVPKYSARLGIVRKCDLCSDRLAAGEAPACVQACPSEAIRVSVVDQEQIARSYREVTTANTFLPGSPAPDYTLPTTRFKSVRPLHKSLQPANAHELKPQCAHTPLGVMLVLSQLSVGGFFIERLMPSNNVAALRSALTLTALITVFAAFAVSTLHLGRPLGAWRAFLGLRKSWLSREIVVFGLFAALGLLYTASVWLPHLLAIPFQNRLGWAASVSGLLGVFCSAMIYHDTRRDFWQLSFSGGKFFGTAALLGTTTTLFLAACVAPSAQFIAQLSTLVIVATIAKLAIELPIFRRLEIEDYSPLHKTALLLDGDLGLIQRCRMACGLIGGVVLPAILALQSITTSPPGGLIFTGAACILALCLAGELMERHLFFVAVQPVNMPGGIAS